ncbi:MAG: hypothetical protein AAF556_09705, partial [Pseudomonadota bacterium]
RVHQANELAAFLTLSEAAYGEICDLALYQCGDGSPQTDHQAFNRDVGDWLSFAPPGFQGLISSSNGAVTTNPTYVWAAQITNDGVRWIKKDYQNQTNALNLVFGMMLLLASSFWFFAAILVEALHERAWRKRRKGAAIKPLPAEVPGNADMGNADMGDAETGNAETGNGAMSDGAMNDGQVGLKPGTQQVKEQV